MMIPILLAAVAQAGAAAPAPASPPPAPASSAPSSSAAPSSSVADEDLRLPRRARRAMDGWIACYAGHIVSLSLTGQDSPEAEVERALAGCGTEETAMRTAFAAALTSERGNDLADRIRASLAERGRADIAAFRPGAAEATAKQ